MSVVPRKATARRPLTFVGGSSSNDQITIAHISDLHFDGSTQVDRDHWRALKLDLTKQRPQIIAVTGDLIDSSVADAFFGREPEKVFRNVRQYLLSLCDVCEIDPVVGLFVIPGNHDYRLKGILPITSVQAGIFRSVFVNEFQHRLIQPLNLGVLSFDSNHEKRVLELASGTVDNNELLDAVEAVAELKPDQKAIWQSATKIALLHHHPMPIAATEGLSGITNVEPFLLLKNSGRFMTAMVENEIDIVLHGHKHYPSFSRATYAGSKGEHTIAVVAGGSVSHTELHARAYNVVRIHRDGHIDAERRELAAGDYTTAYEWTIRDYREARAMKYRRLRREATEGQLHVRRYSRHDMIMPRSGDDHSYQRYEGAKSATNKQVDELVYSVGSAAGSYGLRKYTSDGGQKIESTRTPPRPDGMWDVSTHFTPPIGQTEIDFEFEAVYTNGIYFSRQERLDATNRTSDTESIATRDIHFFDFFSLAASFPPEHFPDSFRIEVSRPDGSPDPVETDFVSPHLIVLRHTNTVAFSIEKPMPKYKYAIIWELPDQDRSEAKLSFGDVGRLAELIRVVRHTASDELKPMLVDLSHEFTKGKIDCCADLFAYDLTLGGLVPVASTDTEELPPETRIRSGVGPVGRAYRRRAMIVSLPFTATGDELDPQADVFPFSSTTTVICAVPLFYPLFTGRPIGIVVLRSQSNTSPLIGALDDSVQLLAIYDRVQTWYAERIGKLANIHDVVPPNQTANGETAQNLIELVHVSFATRSASVKRHAIPMKSTVGEIYEALKPAKP